MDQRLESVYEAASRLFMTKGYANTQVSQIAEAAGIATGTIYNLFTGKKAVLTFVILATLDKSNLDKEVSLPVKETSSATIVRHLVQIIESLFDEIGKRTEGNEPANSFADTLSILFDYAANYHVAFSIINSHGYVLGDVEREYRQSVDRLYRLMEKHLDYYIARGEIRNVELPGLHIHNILEGIAWWAMYVPYQAPDMDLPTAKAKEIALDVLKHAYMTDPD